MAEILCSARPSLPGDWLMRRGFRQADEVLLRQLDELPYLWFPRAELEDDPSYKQWIPYVLLERGGRLAVYPRRGREGRLHAHESCGFGGHVERADEAGTLSQTLLRSLGRELKEECGLCPNDEALHFLGLINEEESAVGRVHIGAVYMLHLAAEQDLMVTEEIVSHEWLTCERARQRPLETWSHLALALAARTGLLV